MRSVAAMAISISTLFFLLNCNGDSGTSPTAPTPTAPAAPVGASAADITVTVLQAAYAAGGQGNAVGFSLRMEEDAGLGANINFIRVDVFRATGQFEERQEIGSGEIVRQTGSNRLEANQTRPMTVIIGFNATVKSGRILRLTVGFTDDRGNVQNKAIDYVF